MAQPRRTYLEQPSQDSLALSSDPLSPLCLCSQIYCYGELLHQVQMAKLYSDDKNFVDMSLSKDPGEATSLSESLLKDSRAEGRCL